MQAQAPVYPRVKAQRETQCNVQETRLNLECGNSDGDSLAVRMRDRNANLLDTGLLRSIGSMTMELQRC